MRLIAFGFLAILVSASACKPTQPVVIDTPTPATSLDSSVDQPTIKVANWEETQQLVAQNAGKVVILDLWASW